MAVGLFRPLAMNLQPHTSGDAEVRDMLSAWLRRVARDASLTDVERLLSLGADPCSTPPEGPPQRALCAVVRAGDHRKMELLFSRGPLPIEAIARAFASLFPSHALDANQTLDAFNALERLAGDQTEPAQAWALSQALAPFGSIRVSEGLLLHGRVDFSKPAPDGSPWAGALIRRQFDPHAQRAANRAFDQSWAAHADKTVFWTLDSCGLSTLHLGAQSGNVHALAAMDGWADWGALSRDGAHPLALAAGAQERDAFDFILARVDSSKNRFGRDGATEALLSTPPRPPKLEPSWDAEEASVQLAQKADPLALDALGRSCADWARELSFPQAASILERRAALATRPGAPQAFFDAQTIDDAILEEISRLARIGKPGVEQAIEGWALKLSTLDAQRSGNRSTALHIVASRLLASAAERLIDLGASPDVLDHQSSPPLFSALLWGWGQWSDPQLPRLVGLLATPQACQRVGMRGDALCIAMTSKPPHEIIELLASQSDLPAHGAAALRLAAQHSLASFRALWPFCQDQSRLASWATPGPGPDWPESLAEKGAIDELLMAQDAGAFGPEGMAGRRAQGRSLLSWAAAAVKDLSPLLPFFNPNDADPLGRDALAFALESGCHEAAALLAARADLLARDRAGFSAMDKALLFGKEAAAHAIGLRLDALEEAAQLRQSLGSAPMNPTERPTRP